MDPRRSLTSGLLRNEVVVAMMFFIYSVKLHPAWGRQNPLFAMFGIVRGCGAKDLRVEGEDPPVRRKGRGTIGSGYGAAGTLVEAIRAKTRFCPKMRKLSD